MDSAGTTIGIVCEGMVGEAGDDGVLCSFKSEVGSILEYVLRQDGAREVSVQVVVVVAVHKGNEDESRQGVLRVVLCDCVWGCVCVCCEDDVSVVVVNNGTLGVRCLRLSLRSGRCIATLTISVKRSVIYYISNVLSSNYS